MNAPTSRRRRGDLDSGFDFSVTVSIGLAEYCSRDASVDDLVHAADEALYRAKRAGRNRIVYAERA